MQTIPPLPEAEYPQMWIRKNWSFRHLLTHHIVDFDGISLAYQRKRLSAEYKHTRHQLIRLSQARAGDTCVIAGNGPSLNDVSWHELDGLDVFASNYAFLNPDLRDRIRYLSVTNPWVASQSQEAFSEWGGWLFSPYTLSYWIPPTDNHLALQTHFGYACADHLTHPISTRSTVSYFNLQLAFILGYSKILLVGFDHHYTQPLDSAEGDIIPQEGEDENHFTPTYFRDKYWQAADINKMDYVYALAANTSERLGIRIFNCSTDSKLRIFPTTSISEALITTTRQPAPVRGSRLARVAGILRVVNHRTNGTDLTTTGLFVLLATVLGASISPVMGVMAFFVGILCALIALFSSAIARERAANIQERLVEGLIRRQTFRNDK